MHSIIAPVPLAPTAIPLDCHFPLRPVIRGGLFGDRAPVGNLPTGRFPVRSSPVTIRNGTSKRRNKRKNAYPRYILREVVLFSFARRRCIAAGSALTNTGYNGHGSTRTRAYQCTDTRKLTDAGKERITSDVISTRHSLALPLVFITGSKTDSGPFPVRTASRAVCLGGT